MCTIHRIAGNTVIAYTSPASHTPSTGELERAGFTDDVSEPAQEVTTPKATPMRKGHSHRQYHMASGAGGQCSHSRGRVRKPKGR